MSTDFGDTWSAAIAVKSSGAQRTPALDVWAHLWRTQLPGILWNTLTLLLGVGAGSVVLGTALAWLVTAYRFPGRALFDWALVLPLAMPGIMTGSIIGLAQAMGETAPLIIVGMVAFIPDVGATLSNAATVLPAQIFTWSGEPDRAFIEKTAGGILVLLSVLIFLNATAVVLRKKFERRW